MTRIYRWTLSWADTPYGSPALFFLALIESSFFPVPPDPLLMALGVAKPSRAIWYGFICTVASVIGGALGYAIGMFFIDSIGIKIIEFYGLLEKYSTIQALYDEYNALVVLVAGVSPIPYKVFTIAAGAFKVNFATFLLASVVGRGFRFMAEGVLLYYYGDKIKDFIDRYITIISWAVGILVILGFVAIKYLIP